ncbi:surface lipoprotein assembly modifier [Pigmentiphaga humi]|nr:surface lipoprotein assembly modifier [Pigmentiphaga humi]
MTSRFQRLLRSAALLFFLCSASAWAQQDTADRLWQGAERQAQQLRRQSDPLQGAGRGNWLEESMLSAWQTPQTRLHQLLLSIMQAVNARDWFGADRLLRQYAQVPGRDPALFTFVEAARLAAEGDYDAAIAGYRQVLQANPKFIRGNLDLARAMMADSRLRDAREIFQQMQARPLPAEVERYIADAMTAIEQRGRLRLTLSVAAVRDDNLANTSRVVDPCALVFYGTCLQNVPGSKTADSGAYFEASLNKLWPLAGHHGVLLRSLNYGNHYRHESNFDNLVSTTYLGYQYSTARGHFQFLPLFELDLEGGREAYRAVGFRTSLNRQLNPRAMIEASYEYKHRDFTERLQGLEGDFRSAMLYGQYAVRPDLLLYGVLTWRESDAGFGLFGYREQIARLGIVKSFNQKVTVNAAYSYRRRQAQEDYAIFGRRQRDHENGLYLSVSLPGYAWAGFTPTMSYEYRNNRSSIPHLYTYERNRFTLGFTKVF